MIRLNQPGIKSFVIYVFGFIFLTLFIYLGIPFFFDYKNNKSDLEKKIFENFGLNIGINNKVKYNIFPSPRLNLQKAEILSFSESSHNVGYSEKVILRIPFKKLISINTLDFDSIELINAVINIQTSEINKFNNYLNNTTHNKPVLLKKSKINLLDKANLLFSIDLKKLRISGKNSFSKLDLKGRVFDTKIKINYQNKKLDSKHVKNISIILPGIGLNLKLGINPDNDNSEIAYGKASILFPNNQIYFDYVLKNKVLNVSSSKLINNYFKGQLLGDLLLFPFSTFDLQLNINLLKFKNILNSILVKNPKLLSQLIPLNDKINGKLNINIDKITSVSNIINSGNVNLEFRNSVLIVKEATLGINKIGNIQFMGQILQKKKKKLMIFNAKINLDNSEIFYSRFLIPKKNRIDLAPINLAGNVNLESFNIKLDELYLNNESDRKELKKEELLLLQEKINEIFSQNSLNNVLKYSNLRKIIQSFF